MKLSLKILPAFVMAISVAGMVACSSSGCFDNRSAIPRVELCLSESGKAQNFTGLEISGVGAPNDSLLVLRRQSVKEFYLPMRSSYNSTEWCIHYDCEGISNPAFNDTILFEYQSQPYFASEDCGAMFNYHITRMHTTTHVLDSVVILDSLITNVDLVRIRIYLPELPPLVSNTPENPDEGEETDSETTE